MGKRITEWVIFLPLVAVYLGACTQASPAFGPISAESPYGYVDRLNPDGRHTLLAVAPSPALARSFWEQRAVELCGGADFKRNVFRAERPVVKSVGSASNVFNPAYSSSYPYDSYGNFFLEGYLTCAGPTPTSPVPK
jgi:hypothetical protein